MNYKPVDMKLKQLLSSQNRFIRSLRYIANHFSKRTAELLTKRDTDPAEVISFTSALVIGFAFANEAYLLTAFRLQDVLERTHSNAALWALGFSLLGFHQFANLYTCGGGSIIAKVRRIIGFAHGSGTWVSLGFLLLSGGGFNILGWLCLIFFACNLWATVRAGIEISELREAMELDETVEKGKAVYLQIQEKQAA